MVGELKRSLSNAGALLLISGIGHNWLKGEKVVEVFFFFSCTCQFFVVSGRYLIFRIEMEPSVTRFYLGREISRPIGNPGE